MPKVSFTDEAVPPFADAPSVILIVGDVEFFVEEAVARAREALGGEDTEALRFEDDAAAESTSDALLNRIWQNNRWSMLNNSMSIPTDNPVRDGQNEVSIVNTRTFPVGATATVHVPNFGRGDATASPTAGATRPRTSRRPAT